MAEKLNCNSCGALTDAVYFYCEECHKKHKRKKEGAENVVLNARSSVPNVSDKKEQALQDDSSKANPVS